MTDCGRTGSGGFDAFLELSAVLTGHERVVLEGTGLAGSYFEEFERVLGPTLSRRLWRAAAEVLGPEREDPELEAKLRAGILADDCLGPLARELLKVWYLGSWFQLPAGWRARFGATTPDFDPEGLDADRVISSAAYKQGLVWPTIGTHPMGAKQPGHGTWSLPPKV